MRTVTRKSLDELAKVMPVLSEREQRVYIGGTSGTTYSNVKLRQNADYQHNRRFAFYMPYARR